MADWTSSMEQTFEYYTVDPASWKNKRKLDNVSACEITRDSTSDGLESATFTIESALDECYIRAYLVVTQDGTTERFCLGTFLAQRSDVSFNGKYQEVSYEAYSPLQELAEKMPVLGSYVAKGEDILTSAYLRVRGNMRAPVVRPAANIKTLGYNFIAEEKNTELSFCADLIKEASYHMELDDLGRLLFAPDQALNSMQPSWTYNDDNSSILQADVTNTQDLYSIPNVVEAIWSGESLTITGTARNMDENSPVGIPRRGREITKRITDVSFEGIPTEAIVTEYAQQQLDNLSCATCTLTYTHAYNGVRVGDCVRMNYKAAGLEDLKARVVEQTIKCETSCQVEETAEYLVYF